MYIDIGTCICKSISIYVSRDAYIGRGLQGIKASKLNPEPWLVGMVERRRRDALVYCTSQAVTVLWFSCPDGKREDRDPFLGRAQEIVLHPAGQTLRIPGG